MWNINEHVHLLCHSPGHKIGYLFTCIFLSESPNLNVFAFSISLCMSSFS